MSRITGRVPTCLDERQMSKLKIEISQACPDVDGTVMLWITDCEELAVDGTSYCALRSPTGAGFGGRTSNGSRVVLGIILPMSN
jgi:hypothetical protein